MNEYSSVEYVEAHAVKLQLEAGERIGMLDAIAIFGIRQFGAFGQLWQLAELVAYGRPGGPLEPEVMIPPSAWQHMKCVIVDIDFIAETREGTRVYDISFVSPKTAGPLDAAGPLSASDEDQAGYQPPSLEEPDHVFQRLAQAPPGGGNWTRDDYRNELKKADLLLTPDNDRVSRIKIGDGGFIARGAGSVSLRNLLLVSRFRAGGASCLQGFAVNKRGAAKHLARWLLDQHPEIVLNEAAKKIREGSDDFADAIVERLLNKFFRVLHESP